VRATGLLGGVLLGCAFLGACGGSADRAPDASTGGQATERPEPVTDVQAAGALDSTSLGSIIVSWTPPVNRGPPISAYQVDIEGRSSRSVPGTTFTEGFVPAGTQRCYRVYAINAAGSSGPAPAPTCATVPVAAPPNPPRNVRAVGIPRGARMEWDEPAPGGTSISDYLLSASPEPPVLATVSRSGRTATYQGLLDGQTYTFTVRSSGPVGISDPAASNAVTVETLWPPGPAWKQGPPLPADLPQGAFVLGGFLYAVTANQVYASALAQDGRPTNWITLGPRPGFGGSSSIALHSADGRGGYLYVTGGGETMSGNPGTCWVARLPGDGTITAFRETSRLDPGPKYHSSTATSGRVYVVGGTWWSGGSFTGNGSDLPFVSMAELAGDGIEVLVGSLLADGGVASWRRASAQLSSRYLRFALTAAAGRLYVLGGTDFDRVTNTVAMGVIDADGDVVDWEVSEADQFSGPRSGAAVAAGAGHLYLIGGDDFLARPGHGSFNDTQWATIDPLTGHLAPPARVPAPRPPGLPLRVRASATDSGAVVHWDPPADDGASRILAYAVTGSRGNVRVEVGGNDTTANLVGLENGAPYTFEVTARNGAGTGRGSGPSETVTPWPSSSWRPASAMRLQAFARQPFIVGEELFARDYTRYLAAPFAADGLPWGQIGPGYQGDTSSSFPRFEASVARPTGDAAACIYYLGGFDGTGSVGTTHVDCVEADGFTGRWLAAPKVTETFAPARERGSALIAEPFLYLLGGTHSEQGAKTDLADVRYTRIAADGTLGSWAAGASLPEPIAAPAVVARGRTLLLVAPPTAPARILRALVQPDGSLDGWRPSGAFLPTAVTGARVAILGDYLYVVGAGSPAVHIGHLDSGGAIDAWESDPDGSFADPVLDLFTAPGRLYVRSGSGVQLARVDPRTGRLLRWR
jgi:hypothetical protein